MFGAALLTRLLTVGHFVTGDDGIWTRRTAAFSDALVAGDLSNATASKGGPATMPGSSTMWLGSLGRLVWSVGQQIGLVGEGEWASSLSGLYTAQTMVALATSLLVVLVVVLVYRWVGWGAAAIAALVLVGEPWIGALGSVFHTDELTALFGTAGLLLLAIVFDVPDRFDVSRPMLGAFLAGALVMSAPLTKVSGVAYGVGAAAVIAFALWRDWTRSVDDDTTDRTHRLKQLGAAAVGAVVIIPISWPALLVDPVTQFGALMDSVALGSTGHEQFFLGNETQTPGWTYYAVALPFRMTPWFLLGVVIAVPVAFVNRATRARAVWVTVFLVPAAIMISQAAKQFDRYGLIVVVPLAVLVGVGLGPYVERWLVGRPALRVVGAVGIGMILFYGLLVAPWGLLYFNPVLGGAGKAQDVLLVGWGEGVEQAVEMVAELEDGDCRGVTVAGVRTNVFGKRTSVAPLHIYGVPCSTPPVKGSEPTYVIVYVNDLQRSSDKEVDRALRGRQQVGEVEAEGITLATIWR